MLPLNADPVICPGEGPTTPLDEVDPIDETPTLDD